MRKFFLGDFTAALDIATLKRNNVKAVLTAAIGLDIRYESDDKINHKVINAYDIDSYNIAQHFDDAIEFIAANLTKGFYIFSLAIFKKFDFI